MRMFFRPTPCPEGTYCIYLGGIFNQNEDPVPQSPALAWRSYYFAGGKRIAMREVNALGDPFGTVTWLEKMYNCFISSGI
jgi:hypothetical protein